VPIRDYPPPGAPVWIDLATSDLQRGKDFYGALFGWTAEDTGPDYGDYVNFSKDGVLVAGMMANQQPGVPDSWTTYLVSTDVKTTADAVLSAGGQVLMEPMQVGQMGSMAVFADPTGAVVGVWQAGEHKGYGVSGEDGTPAWLELLTTDYGSAVPFYERAFGWETKVLSDTDEFRYTVFDKDDTQYAGIMDAASFLPPGVPSNWQIYLQVPDVDAALAKVTELGGTVLQPAEDSPYGRLAQVTDPSGAPFKLMTPPDR
jgi:predicted enzyme related to lactoylglutathione lyase